MLRVINKKCFCSRVAKEIPKDVMIELERLQKVEITEHYLYKALAVRVSEKKNRQILEHIALDELAHYKLWKKYTKKDFKASKWTVWKYLILSKLFGIVFAVKLMGKKESCVSVEYKKLKIHIPEVQKVISDELDHEREMVGMIHEEKLNYLGSIVLGLNDALIELTGALAGFTLAFLNTQFIAIAGLITGIAASLSMAASEYLSTKSEKTKRNPFRAAFYTGIAYFGTVLFLIFPYFVMNKVYFALGWTVLNAIFVVMIFTYYSSVTQEEVWHRKFLEMLVISMGVAGISFLVGFAVRMYFGIQI
jgi:vacuolar iron transporter family protein